MQVEKWISKVKYRVGDLFATKVSTLVNTLGIVRHNIIQSNDGANAMSEKFNLFSSSDNSI